MEALILLLVATYVLALPFLVIVAFSRTSRLREEQADLRMKLNEIQARNVRLESRTAQLQADLAALRVAPQADSAQAPVSISKGLPESAKAEFVRPAMAQSELVQPDLARPDLVSQDLVRPEFAQPRAADKSDGLSPVSDQAGIVKPSASGATERALQVDILLADVGLAQPAPPVADIPATDVAAPEVHRTASNRFKPRKTRPEVSGPSWFERAFSAARDWLFGGNTLVRLGLVLVFLGLAFLMRYASDHIVISLGARYFGVALAAVVALGIGWRLRRDRPAYALTMQGGAVAVMYLAVYAALRLHDQPLLSGQTGFALMLAVVVLAGLLAIFQDAMVLAVVGALGGFATPVLLSTGGGDAVALFSYLALLNAGILGIAWFKAWRPLNLVGFFGTSLIAYAWGQRSYDPLQHYAAMQGFLVLFFLMYVLIGFLFARRMLCDAPDAPPDSRRSADWAGWLAQNGQSVQHYVDGTLIFGTPFFAFGMQYGLVRHLEHGSAISALVLGLFYLALMQIARLAHPQRLGLLAETYLALGVIFASLAIPLGFNAEWTSASWAVEATGLFWLGLRQRRPLARGFALLLIGGACLAFVTHLHPGTDNLVAGSAFGALLLGLSMLGTSWLTQRQDEAVLKPGEVVVVPILTTLGLWCLYGIAPLLWAAQGTAMAWALAGLVTVTLALRGQKLGRSGWLGNGLAVQLLAGLLYFSQSWQLLGHLLAGYWFAGYSPEAVQNTSAFAHHGFLTPVVIAVAAALTAWQLHLSRLAELRDLEKEEAEANLVESAMAWDIGWLPLIWSAGWWALAWWLEWRRIDDFDQAISHHFLATMALSSLVAMFVARLWVWPRLLTICGLLPLLVVLIAAVDYHHDLNWLAAQGWLAYGLAFVSSVAGLRLCDRLLGDSIGRFSHLAVSWAWLIVAAVASRYLFLNVGAPDGAWHWIGWMLPWLAWLLWQGSSAGTVIWPMAAHPALYRYTATLPVVGSLLLWGLLANIRSGGESSPLPFVPLLNPLDLTLIALNYGVWRWLQRGRQDLADAVVWNSSLQLLGPLLAVSGFVTYSGAVLRAVHHHAGLPWLGDGLLHFMLAQSALSIAWALLALGLMITGHRRALRWVWLAGAVLVAVVVGKMFLIELADRGGLERIVSFIGVGILLLVVGYFAPLPPAAQEDESMK